MLDIGAIELFVVAVLALVVVGPKELPKLLRTVGGFMRKVREMAAEFRSGVEDLAAEVEREVDPFSDLRKQEGLRPGMSPQEITEHIMANKEREAVENAGLPEEAPDKPSKKNENSPKNDEKPQEKVKKAPKKSPEKAKSQTKKSSKTENPAKAAKSVKTKKPVTAQKSKSTRGASS